MDPDVPRPRRPQPSRLESAPPQPRAPGRGPRGTGHGRAREGAAGFGRANARERAILHDPLARPLPPLPEGTPQAKYPLTRGVKPRVGGGYFARKNPWGGGGNPVLLRPRPRPRPRRGPKGPGRRGRGRPARWQDPNFDGPCHFRRGGRRRALAAAGHRQGPSRDEGPRAPQAPPTPRPGGPPRPFAPAVPPDLSPRRSPGPDVRAALGSQGREGRRRGASDLIWLGRSPGPDVRAALHSQGREGRRRGSPDSAAAAPVKGQNCMTLWRGLYPPRQRVL